MTHRYAIIADVDNQSAANNAAASWDPDTGGDQTFGNVKLSADGTTPASHTGCNTLTNSTMRTQILDALGNVPLYDVYRVQGKSTTGDVERKDKSGWTAIGTGDIWQVALSDAGLQVIQPETI